MKILDGKALSYQRRKNLREQIFEFKRKVGYPPGLAVLSVGNNASSQIYIKNKIKACKDVGIQSLEYKFLEKAREEEVKKLIQELNESQKIHGILIQLPLPAHLNSRFLFSFLSPLKDVDSLTLENMGLLFSGNPRVLPCTPLGIIHLLEHYKYEISGKKAVVIGRSLIVGKPMFELLQKNQATVTLCHSKTKNLLDFTKAADISVVAAGQPRFLGKDAFKKGSIVIDVGIHRLEDPLPGSHQRLCGDVRFEELKNFVEAATPVPGGVGPMTICSLLENTFRLALILEKMPLAPYFKK